MKKLDRSKIKIPELPYGQGSISFCKNDSLLVYKKTINGNREAVYGESVREVMDKMCELEISLSSKPHKRAHRGINKADLSKVSKENQASKDRYKKNKTDVTSQNGRLLKDVMIYWLHKIKRHEVKDNSFDRMICTYDNQILGYRIAERQVQSVDVEMITDHIEELINENLSYSCVKKAYELFNQFFGWYYKRTPMNNPMLQCAKPTKASMNVREKEIEFFEDEDIDLFIKGALSTLRNGQPRYRLGYGIVGFLFSGMRENEALALRWNRLDFERSVVRIDDNRARVIDWEGTPKPGCKYAYKYIYTTPKTKASTREEQIPRVAMYCFKKLKEQVNPNEDDFVFQANSNRIGAVNERNFRRTVNAIQAYAGTEIQDSGLHVLRHTFISLLCRNKVDKKVIAKIVGHDYSTEMIDKIYQHVTKKEKVAAIVEFDEQADERYKNIFMDDFGFLVS